MKVKEYEISIDHYCYLDTVGNGKVSAFFTSKSLKTVKEYEQERKKGYVSSYNVKENKEGNYFEEGDMYFYLDEFEEVKLK